ncbi:MAG TPA: PDZ domain-containing protein [Gemmatimonadaceae bacterium]|nr:PDZ domain-containing protein [Gemmatimonadaceae bacterium]
MRPSSKAIASTAFALLPLTLSAQQRSVEYDISFPNAAQHEARVVATFHGVPAGTALQVRMSQSSPGRYARSTFAKNVYDVAVVDGRGRAVSVTRPDTHGWDVRGHDGTVKVSYVVWGDRIDGTYLSVDHSHAHLNMPATFMFAHGMDAAPIRLTIHPRSGWKIATQLAPTRDPGVFTAPNMQYFMDSPTEIGPVSQRSWTKTHGGRKSTWNIAMHHLGTEAQLDSFTVMVRRIVDEEIAMWGEPAGYDMGTFTFLLDYVPWANGDGMEHRNSTVVTSGRNTIADRAKRIASLGTVTHEFFHSWNMERLRSKEIEPFDFDRENISDGLWFGEGFTNYYAPLFIRRAGFYSDEEYAGIIGEDIVATINTPARRHGSPVDMSRQAPFFDGGSYLDPLNRQNTFFSYYPWGSIVALGLDLTLRERFNSTLDDLMRKLWQNRGKHQSAAFAPERPYTVSDLRNELGAFTRDSTFANDFFRRYVEGREVPDFAKLLEPAGFHLAVDSAESPWLGASLDNDTSKVFVNWSQEGSSAYDAGLASGDYIVAINGVPAVTVDSVNAMIARRKVGDVVQLDVEQKTVRRKIPMTIRGRRGMKVVSYESAGMPVTEAIRNFRRSWLGSRI